MRKRRNTLPVIAFSTSLLMHAMLLVVLPYAIEAATPNERIAHRNVSPESQVMVLPLEVALGIDAPTPETPTWIGFAEPEEQRAEKAEIEQAAFTVEPVAAAPPALAMAPETPAPQAPQPHEQPEPQPAPMPTQLARAPEQVHEQIAPPPPSIEELIGDMPLGDDVQLNLNPSAPQTNPEQAEAVADAIEAVKELLREIQKAVGLQASESSKTADAKPAAEAPPPLPPAAQPALQIQPGAPAPQAPTEAGSPADKQTSPTSLIEIPADQWQLGKPLARQGLTLKPRRPEFTLLTLLTAAPGNPHVIINFGRDGVPVTASLARSSGDRRVDDAILASLYRWRAEGKDLERLAPGKTLDVRMRIVLNRRAPE